ncbi:MAG: sugar phosphate nucleotidyltransferase, partial [Candidatus Hydrogenedentales bacterium]
MKAVILAAGKSTRTYPLTLTRPKPLLPIANRPLLARQLDALAGLVDEVLLVVGYRQEMIRERFGDHYRDIRLVYVEQTEQQGTGHAVLQCAPHLNGPALVLNGDDLYAPEDLRALVATEQGCLGYEVDDPRRFGVLETKGDRIVRVVEKPAQPTSNMVSIGAYKFPTGVCEILRTAKPSARGEIEIVAAMQALADAGGFRVVRSSGYWLPIGYPWDLIEANTWWLENRFEARNEGKVSPAAHLSGPVSVGPDTAIKPGAVIEGPVIIGE